MPKSTAVALAITSLFAFACPDDEPRDDAGVPAEDAGPAPQDAGGVEDAGVQDGGPRDAGAPQDAGIDAGPDAGADAGPPPCTAPDAGNPCPDGLACCDGACRDLALPPDCETCANTCTVSQVCAVGGCADVSLSTICTSTRLISMLHLNDEANTNAFAAIVEQSCGLTAETADIGPTAEEAYGDLIVGPGDGLVTTGGPFFNKLSEELSAHSVIRFGAIGDDVGFIRRADDSVVVQSAPELLDEGHDFFLIELVAHGQLGHHALIAYGINQVGTDAAVSYFQDTLAPGLATAQGTGMVVEWTDANNDDTPDPGDTFTVIETF